MSKNFHALSVTKDLKEERVWIEKTWFFIRVSELNVYEVRHYVYIFKVSKPKSQSHGAFLFGPFISPEAAFLWAKERELIDYLVLKI